MDNTKPIEVDTQKLIKEALSPDAPTPQVTPEQMVSQTLDSAAKLLDHYVPIFEAGIKKLSSNKLRRILKNLVEYPLTDKAYKPKEDEGTLFLIGSRILEAKHTLIMYTMFSQASQHKQTIVENSTPVEVKPPTE